MNGVYLGLDFGGTTLVMAVADAGGQIVARRHLPTDTFQGATEAVRHAIAVAEELVTEAGGPLLGTGVATMGVTLADRVLMAPVVPGWENLALPPLLRTAFGRAPMRVENDTKAAAFAELRQGALQEVDTGIYLNLGSGIAAALIAGGRILRGAHGAAGEIGYNLRSPDERQGAHAGHAPFEEFAAGYRLAALAAERGSTVRDLLAAMDPPVQAVLAEIAFHLANLTIALDAGRIVIGGGLMRSADIVVPALRVRIEPFLPFPVEIRPAHFGPDAALMGALLLAREPMPVL